MNGWTIERRWSRHYHSYMTRIVVIYLHAFQGRSSFLLSRFNTDLYHLKKTEKPGKKTTRKQGWGRGRDEEKDGNGLAWARCCTALSIHYGYFFATAALALCICICILRWWFGFRHSFGRHTICCGAISSILMQHLHMHILRIFAFLALHALHFERVLRTRLQTNEQTNDKALMNSDDLFEIETTVLLNRQISRLFMRFYEIYDFVVLSCLFCFVFCYDEETPRRGREKKGAAKLYIHLDDMRS